MAGNSQAMTGLGIVIAMKATANATTYTDIGEPTDITPPQSMDDEIEVTHYNSPNGTKEFIGGLTDPGECTFTINYIPDGATERLILGAKALRKPRGFKLTWPNGVTWTFDLLIRGFQPTAPLNDRLTAEVTGRVSGSVVITPAPSGGA
ncbi:hypothetical protein COA17_07275 [Sphingomonas ginsenosidimutans]|uniref:Lambda phage tail tube protein N-terminal domain-containing protein n=1 Tax=Sphingomonas ginsenosidimutans TaxID=862134 RepID=A0A2A4HXP4_9SPHN|nr:phage tail tube protein [Sphingomonas ginsenosidimutans]PCG09652.1 hypothetical protein COA17_07275 [Sphingomonas ginsenosidimutans]